MVGHQPHRAELEEERPMSLFQYIFRDSDNDIIAVRGTQEYVITGNPGGYIWCDHSLMRERQQVFTSFSRGNALYYPHGKTLGYKPAKNKMGTEYSIPIYEELSGDEELAAVARELGAKILDDREAAMHLVRRTQEKMNAIRGESDPIVYYDVRGNRHELSATT
jgi:hypothetical protein